MEPVERTEPLVIVAIETSDVLCSMAFWDNNRTLLEYNLELPMQHAALIGELLDNGLAFLGAEQRPKHYSMNDLNLVVVSIGPGSFTGLRIGLSFAQGICFGRDIPIVGISNHDILASQAVKESGPLFTIIDARRDEVYLAEHERDEDRSSRIISHRIVSVTNLAENLPSEAELVFRDAVILPDEMTQSLRNKYILINSRARYSAGIAARLGQERFLRNGPDNLDDLEPMYIRSFAGVL